MMDKTARNWKEGIYYPPSVEMQDGYMLRRVNFVFGVVTKRMYTRE